MLGLLIRHKERGDTIVEVIIAMAIISLVLVAAFASTSHNVRVTQDTQEHTQALQLVQGQIEFLRGAGKLATSGDCFNSTTGVEANGSPCTITPNGVGTEPAYQLKITKPVGLGAYALTVTWNSVVDNNSNNIILYYRPQT